VSRARTWTCRKCRSRHPRIKQKCPCGQARPSRKTAAQKALVDRYEMWAERFGDRCNICLRAASQRRRLDRDHDHKTGAPRGLLCARCNRALPSWVTPEWLRSAADYLERAA
jgi:Recombination endonuclease VII